MSYKFNYEVSSDLLAEMYPKCTTYLKDDNRDTEIKKMHLSSRFIKYWKYYLKLRNVSRFDAFNEVLVSKY